MPFLKTQWYVFKLMVCVLLTKIFGELHATKKLKIVMLEVRNQFYDFGQTIL